MLGWILILSIAVLLFVVFHNKDVQTREVPYSTFRMHLEQKHISSVVVKDGETIEATMKKDRTRTSRWQTRS